MEKKVWKTWVIDQSGEPKQVETVQYDYVPFGSPDHMGLLGIRKVEQGEKPPYQFNGYCFEDVRQVQQPQTTREFLEQELQSRVNELNAVPTAPKTAPPMWRAAHGSNI